ncbi:hypothetical protein POM88_053233 [Heracleum sosnowskyi]|uniref:SAM-dependent MTase RsmB/NOP-type domain-containing protein n=1 Tax=Heracleum sosnowskyi TaxID=360622 RepID=A0AAD8GQ27_9APIA|nr:hypothetical protein POM88_053232 [Heracleum sosnowskyi]KAK1352536.1 hypothetical protein POM88_053233 [Heracleum sosnowskyi]
MVEVPEGNKDSSGGPWEFIALLPLFDPVRHDSAETIRRALELGLLLLTNGFKLLKVGGYLVYNTCSLTVAQNENVVEQFLLQNSSAGSLEVELEAKVNKKVQDNMMLLKKLAEANPALNLDIADYCATVPSEDDEKPTPFTVGTFT